MSDFIISRAIVDAQSAGHEHHIRDKNGRVTSIIVEKGDEARLDLSDLELASNLGCSTEIRKQLEKNRRN